MEGDFPCFSRPEKWFSNSPSDSPVSASRKGLLKGLSRMGCNPGGGGPGCSGLDAAPAAVQAARGAGAPAAPGPGTRDSPAPLVSPRRACPPRRLRGAGGRGPPGPLARVQATAAPPAPGVGAGPTPSPAFPLQTRASLGLAGAAASPVFYFFSNQRARQTFLLTKERFKVLSSRLESEKNQQTF